MARKRFVTSNISVDRNVAKLAAEDPVAAALWPWFITAFDDWGRMSADPVEVKLTVFPAFPYTYDDISKTIQLYHQYGLAFYYEVENKPYLAVNPEKWYKYQTYIQRKRKEAQKPNHPEPLNAPWVDKPQEKEPSPSETVKEQSITTNVAELHSTTFNAVEQQKPATNALSPSPPLSPPPSLSPRNTLKDCTSSDVVKMPTAAPTPFDEIITIFHNTCLSLPSVQVLTDKRKRLLRARWRADPSLKTFRDLFRKSESSDYLSGRNGKWTSCNFDWLLKEDNFVKVLEGTYDNRAKGKGASNGASGSNNKQVKNPTKPGFRPSEQDWDAENKRGYI